ncbi:flavodoxin-dependent (E)-4-hydroxy-3-methylbut-2-enyl-diphosphate synthase [Candidatus Dependentiae bacterium]|nr:flavodoxin-dependent (E)-4-hydroxy-3-methylbut-2-enyl-diphosphate synthase [Candidatus Dependentiae bacterium]
MTKNLITPRKKTKQIKIKNFVIGNCNIIRIQSMCNIKTSCYRRVLNQMKKLQKAGCEIIRVSVKDEDDIEGLKKITKSIDIPIVADIHFDYKLALKSIESGISKLRINPGNITDKWKIKEIVNAAKNKNIPIRVGVNLGSLEKPILHKLESKKISIEQAMTESAIKEVQYLEELNFTDIVVSLKTSDVLSTVKSYLMFSKKRNYPLHIGITETGTLRCGLIKSAVGLSQILSYGIGDTIRVSLSADPIEEVYAAYKILASLKLRTDTPDLIACPTCGRTQINLIKIAEEVEKLLYNVRIPVKVAVMGCVVNGPGEARDADIGITGGNGVGLLFKKGKIVKKVPESEILNLLKSELKKIVG